MGDLDGQLQVVVARAPGPVRSPGPARRGPVAAPSTGTTPALTRRRVPRADRRPAAAAAEQLADAPPLDASRARPVRRTSVIGPDPGDRRRGAARRRSATADAALGARWEAATCVGRLLPAPSRAMTHQSAAIGRERPRQTGEQLVELHRGGEHGARRGEDRQALSGPPRPGAAASARSASARFDSVISTSVRPAPTSAPPDAVRTGK